MVASNMLQVPLGFCETERQTILLSVVFLLKLLLRPTASDEAITTVVSSDCKCSSQNYFNVAASCLPNRM